MSELDNAQDGAVVAPATQDSITEPQAIKQESTPAENAKEEAEKESGVQKRINELTKSWRTEERQKQAIAAENAELKRQLQERQAVQTTTQSAALPKLKDFNYDEDAHAAALESYFESKATDSIQSYLAKQEQKKESDTMQETLEKVFQAHEKRAVEFAKTNADFHQAVDSLASVVSFHPAVAQVIGESEVSPQILYYLANNLDEADRIVHMPVHLATAQIARIEARLSSSAAKTISNAPPPTTQIRGGSVVSTDPAKLSDADWYRQRQSKSK